MKLFTGFMMFLILLFACVKGATAEEAASQVASGITISQCGKTTGLILVDTQGGLHPVDPRAIEANPDLVFKLSALIPEGKGVTVTVPCIHEDSAI